VYAVQCQNHFAKLQKLELTRRSPAIGCLLSYREGISESYMAQLRLLHYIDRSIVGAILVALFVVPLAMPAYRPEMGYMFGELKAFTMHLAAIIVAIALIAEAVIRLRSGERLTPCSKFNFEYFQRNPVRIAVLGLFLLVGAEIFSALMSPLPKVSFFGLYETFSGFNVYDWSGLTIILAGVALKFRSVSRLEYLIGVLVVVGSVTSVYGLAQHFGWDDFGRRQDENQIGATFGNSLNFAAFLVMTIPLTIFLALSERWRKRPYLPLFVLVLSVQLAALWINGGRAPLVATIVGTGILLFVLWLGLGRTALIRAAAVMAVAAVLAVVVIALPSPSSFSALDRFRTIDNQFGQFIGEQSSGGGDAFSGRSEIWKTTVSLVLDPEVAQEESSVKTELRRIFGVGPDMFSHSYALRMHPFTNVRNQIYAHNLPLHILLTTGLFGFVALVILFLGLAVIAWRVFIRLRARLDEPRYGLLVTAVLIATLAGKFTEMQAGIPRVSDLTATFAIIGAIIAGYMISAGVETESETPEPTKVRGQARQLLSVSWIPVVLGSLAILGLLTLFISWDVHRLSSSVIAIDVGGDNAGRKYFDANQREPERRFFLITLFGPLKAASALAHEEGRSADAQSILLEARSDWQRIEARDPYEYKAVVALALISKIMVDRGHTEFVSEMVDRYAKLARYFPKYPTFVGTAATVAASAGEYDLAIELAERAIASEELTHGWSKAWYAKGISLVILGREDEGMLDLITATEKEPDSEGARQSHQALAQLYRERGQLDKAELHESLASP